MTLSKMTLNIKMKGDPRLRSPSIITTLSKTILSMATLSIIIRL